jgi:anti-anti-sigma regulatory factor
LTFIDSSGAAALLTAYRFAHANGVALRLAHLHGSPLAVLKILGVIDLFGI